MMKIQFSLVSKVIHEQEKIIEDIKKKRMLKEYFVENNIMIFLCTLIYGAVLGTYVDSNQVVINAIKIPLLFFVTLYISLPIFYILEQILGNKVDLTQIAMMLLTGYLIAAIIMLAFTPFMLFFILTAKEYYFTIFLNIGIMGLSGYFSLYYIYRNYVLFHDNRKWYPSFVTGSFIIAFVGTQLSWALRPYFHSYDKFTRPTQGNFFVAMAETAAEEPIIASSLLCSFGFVAFLITLLFLQNSSTRKQINEKSHPRVHQPDIVPLRPYSHYPQVPPEYIPVARPYYPHPPQEGEVPETQEATGQDPPKKGGNTPSGQTTERSPPSPASHEDDAHIRMEHQENSSPSDAIDSTEEQ